MSQKYIPELLAPAGSLNALKSALAAGADAVYLSGEKFGARHFAENFNKFEIEKALKYSHLRNVKVYVTVNTLIKDFELEGVVEYLLWLYKQGVDAVIIQDVGVARLCRELIPELRMHVSTQMTIHNLEGVEWAREFGFKRVVLSREMKISEIEKIANKINGIELEIFAHGALCYCYSGQCLLSSFIGGRSGNRGRCAQPCRKPYQLLKGKRDKYGRPINLSVLPLKENYLLSTRDLSLYKNLDKISNLPIDSVKIEGRMRSPEYVATVVSIYRKALDSISQQNWKPEEYDVYKLKLAFNRGFTTGYLLENEKNAVMGCETPGNRGLYLGKVVNYKNKTKKAVVKSEIKFKPGKGDGIVFISPHSKEKQYNSKEKQYNSKEKQYNSKEKRQGMTLEEKPKYEGDKIFLNTRRSVETGSKVYITRDASLIKETERIIQEDQHKLSLPLDLSVSWDEQNRPFIYGEFSGPAGEKYENRLEADFIMDKAIKSPLSKYQIEKQIKKTGGTPFKIRHLKVHYPGNLFTPLSNLNRFRRNFLKKAESQILNHYKPQKYDVQQANNRLTLAKKELSSPPKTLEVKKKKINLAVYSSSLKTLEGALEGGCRRIYFQPLLGEHFNPNSTPEAFDPENYYNKILELISKAHDLCQSKGALFIWKWPEITSNHYLSHSINLINTLYEEGVEEVMVSGTGAARSINNFNSHLKLSGSMELNVCNHQTVLELSKTFHSLTLSVELSKYEVGLIIARSRDKGVNTDFEFMVQGNLEAMISENCIISPKSEKDRIIEYHDFWGIKDVTKRIFPITIDNEGRTVILNSVETCLIDHLPDLYRMGLDILTIDARARTKTYARDMTTFYGDAITHWDDVDKGEYLNKLKLKIKKISNGGITTGNFLKGLKERS
jgi:U32 family peptidase